MTPNTDMGSSETWSEIRGVRPAAYVAAGPAWKSKNDPPPPQRTVRSPLRKLSNDLKSISELGGTLCVGIPDAAKIADIHAICMHLHPPVSALRIVRGIETTV